jgi:hypothetical protein
VLEEGLEMAVPAFLSSSYYAYHAPAVVNMSGTAGDTHALSVIYSALSGQTPAWTLTDGRGNNPPTVTAESPHDTDGRFFKMVFTDVAASSDLKMSMAVTDQNGNHVTGASATWEVRVGGSASATWDVWVFSGQYHFHMDFYFNAVAPDFFRAGITDFTPEAQTQNSHYVFGQGSKNTSDSVTGNTAESAWMIDNITANVVTRQGGPVGRSSTANGCVTPGGYARFTPVELWCYPTGSSAYKWAGRAYQQLFSPAGTVFGQSFPYRSRVVVPIDIGTTGTFQVTCVPVGSIMLNRIMMRVA